MSPKGGKLAHMFGAAVLFLLPVFTPGPSAATEGATLRLDVLLVNDPDFPPVTEADARAILREAQDTFADKLAFADLSFEMKGSISVEEFLAHAQVDPACLKELEPYRVRPDGRMPRDIPKDVVMRFLRRWQVDALQAFFPTERQKKLTSYEAIYAALMDEFARKLELIGSFQLQSGRSLLHPDTLDRRSYVRWICAVRHQPLADLVLTNAFILYDLGSEPYPHSIFAKNKVGGASLHSATRKAIGSRAVIASTFSMVTPLPYFREEGVDALSVAERQAVIGTFIVAHELGHAVFKLPDFYDHPKECLMTTKYETGYVSGYHNLKKFPGACSACQPYVAAKRHVFLAEGAVARGDRPRAIEELKEAIRTTPKHIDGSYLRYMASLSVRVAEHYVEMGDPKEARRWLQAALRIVPDHDQALALKGRIDKPG